MFHQTCPTCVSHHALLGSTVLSAVAPVLYTAGSYGVLNVISCSAGPAILPCTGSM